MSRTYRAGPPARISHGPGGHQPGQRPSEFITRTVTTVRPGPLPGQLVREECGSATTEFVLLAPLLLFMLLFMVFCGRLADTSQRINDVAHQAARAASQARTPAAATTDAHLTAQRALASVGVICQSLSVQADTRGLRPGSTMTVTVACEVGLSDLTLLGVPASTSLRASSASVVDLHRGTGTIPGSEVP